MTWEQITEALEYKYRADALLRTAMARLRDSKLLNVKRKTERVWNEATCEAKNEMAVKVTEELKGFSLYRPTGNDWFFYWQKHLDDSYYPVAYTVAAVLYENGARA